MSFSSSKSVSSGCVWHIPAHPHTNRTFSHICKLHTRAYKHAARERIAQSHAIAAATSTTCRACLSFVLGLNLGARDLATRWLRLLHACARLVVPTCPSVARHHCATAHVGTFPKADFQSGLGPVEELHERDCPDCKNRVANAHRHNGSPSGVPNWPQRDVFEPFLHGAEKSSGAGRKKARYSHLMMI